MISIAILREPLIEKENINKGAILLSQVDKVVEIFPEIKTYFYLIERKGWEGINTSKHADIKLIEDSSSIKETKRLFPKAILLDIAGADFVDTNNFRPLNLDKEYDAIQISAWQDFKRHELLIESAKLMPKKKFLKFGHLFFESKEEISYKKNLVKKIVKECKNIHLPYGNLELNRGLPNSSKEINEIINKAKIGIITSKVEGINRFKLECLSANIPVLVPKDSNTPLKKHINAQTGVFYNPTPEGLVEAVKKVEKNYSKFSPRKYILSKTGNKNSLKKLKKALTFLAKKEGGKNIYSDIYYDGRNQSLIWGEKAKDLIKRKLKKYRERK